jgi:hypothetical protein
MAKNVLGKCLYSRVRDLHTSALLDALEPLVTRAIECVQAGLVSSQPRARSVLRLLPGVWSLELEIACSPCICILPQLMLPGVRSLELLSFLLTLYMYEYIAAVENA